MWLNQQPQSPRGFSALARLYYLATKTAMLRRLHQPLLPLRALCEDYWGRVSQKPETGFEKV